MKHKFRAIRNPSPAVLTQVAALSPENPFCLPVYAECVSRRGLEPIALLLNSEGITRSGCLAFLGTGRLNRRLEITSLPSLENGDIFWSGLIELCYAERISILEVNTFGSTDAPIKALEGEISRKKRYEFQLDLAGVDIWKGLNRRNRRSVNKAMEAGLQIARAVDQQACIVHADIANSSLHRRRLRGEKIEYHIEKENASAFVQTGVGEIYQARLGDQVLSSLLVLRTKTGAYAQTSGTVDDGLEYGSASFLWYETARLLQSDSVTLLNMGGTAITSIGLQEFKAGFGARRIELESAEFYFGSAIRKVLGNFAGQLRLGS